MASRGESPPPRTPSKKKRARTSAAATHASQSLPIFVLDMEEANGGGEILIYGCTAERQSVLLRVAGFRYSFFLDLPGGNIVEDGLNREVEHDIRTRIRGHVDFTSEVVTRRSLVLYQREPDTLMLRIYPATRSATNRIVAAFQAVVGKHNVVLYETQVDVLTRFSLDSGIRCGEWLEVPGGADDDDDDDEEEQERAQSRRSICDVEMACTWDAEQNQVRRRGQPIQLHSFAEPQWSGLPPLKVLSLSVDRYSTSLPDSAWAPKGEDCPDPVRMIGVVLTYENGGNLPHSRTKILLLNTAGLDKLTAAAQKGAPTSRKLGVGGGWVTRLYGNEKDLLQAFEDLVLQEDPSLLTGFEVGEALRVLLGRADALKMWQFGAFSRRRGDKVSVKSQQSYGAKWVKEKARMSATTNQEGTEVHCSGRVVLDLMRVVQMGEALRIYSLGDISMHVLGRTFEVLSTAQLESLFAEEDRLGWSRAMQAGLSPAVLALDVLSMKNGVAELVEVARVTGMPLAYVYIRGQMARVTSLLQIHATRQGVVIPTTTEGLLDKTALAWNALLLDPSVPSASNPEGISTVGLHTSPIAVLDFRSLYPSIMVQHNLCYSTLVTDSTQLQKGQEEEEAFTTPLGARFVKAELRQGVVPSLLADLLGARRHAQQMLKDPRTNEGEKRVLDARQKAFKLAANAVYGYTGASVNSLFSRELGDSILALGRESMTRVIDLVGKDYPQLKVVYGDTDSVFVEYPGWTPEAAKMHSREVLTPALDVQLPARIQVKHEKVLAPLLLQHIRRYAGYEILEESGADSGGTTLHQHRLEIKGMEAVARNSMPFLVDLMKSTLALILDSVKANGQVDVAGVKAYVRHQVMALMTNKPDLYSLTWTKGLWRLGEYDAKLPHAHLIEKLEQQDPRRQFRVGERVAYVFVQREADAPLYKKAEFPPLVLAQNMTLDLAEYLKQVRMPMVRMLLLVMPVAEAEELFKPAFRAAPAGKVSSASSISRFFARSTGTQCINCLALLPAEPASGGKGRGGGGGRSGGRTASANPAVLLCASCKAFPLKSLIPSHETLRACETEHQRAYSHCSGCQRGSRHWEVLCPNETCPVFYKREKFARERQEAAAKVEELEGALLQCG